MSEVLNLISGPRNISTALMYSFGNRKDTAIIDEPFYACYLKRYNVEYHPGTDEILNTMTSDPEEVIKEIIFAKRPEKYVFVKNMAHHLKGYDHSYIHRIKNIFLIRNPRQLIASFSKVIERPNSNDIGVEREKELYDEIIKNGQYPPIVIDSGEVLKDPKGVLKKLCQSLEVPFDARMLSWNAGPRKEDGIWAKYWYANVHNSTGFIKNEQKYTKLSEELEELHNKVQPHYEYLFQKSIKA